MWQQVAHVQNTKIIKKEKKWKTNQNLKMK